MKVEYYSLALQDHSHRPFGFSRCLCLATGLVAVGARNFAFAAGGDYSGPPQPSHGGHCSRDAGDASSRCERPDVHALRGLQMFYVAVSRRSGECCSQGDRTSLADASGLACCSKTLFWSSAGRDHAFQSPGCFSGTDPTTSVFLACRLSGDYDNTKFRHQAVRCPVREGGGYEVAEEYVR